MCNSIVSIMKNITDAEAKDYADRLNSFVRKHFTMSHVHELAREQLSQFAATYPFPNDNSFPTDDSIYFPGANLKLTKLTCVLIKQSHSSHIAEGKRWQIEEWFDEHCHIRHPSPYLLYVPLRY